MVAFDSRRLAASILDIQGLTPSGFWFAMDLSPLLRDDTLDLVDYVDQYLQRFTHDVRARLAKRLSH